MTTTVTLGPAVVNISGVRAGDANDVAFTLTTAGTPVDLTGATITAQVRRSLTAEEFTAATVIMAPDLTTGRFTLRWEGEDVRTLLAGKPSWGGVWDVQLAQGPDVKTLAAGTFTAGLDVTR